MLACSGVRPPFRRLQAERAATSLSSYGRRRMAGYNMVDGQLVAWRPQYWQV